MHILLRSWTVAFTDDFPGRDFSVNIALYVPLGMAGSLTFVRPVSLLILSALLSLSIELLQAYHPLRYCSALDFAANVAGTGLGLVLTKSFHPNVQEVARRWHFPPLRDRTAFALVLCWVVAALFPFFPQLGWTAVKLKAVDFWHEPVRAVSVISGAITFLTLGRLMTAARLPGAGGWLLAGITLVPFQLLIDVRQPSIGYLAGSVAGWITFVATARHRMLHIVCALFLGVLLYRGLVPFEFQSFPNPFEWVPFATLIEDEDGRRGLSVLLEKTFYYGASIWLLTQTGMKPAAAAATAAALAVIEIAQIRIPGRSPEITDPVLAILIGMALRAINKTLPVESHLGGERHLF